MAKDAGSSGSKSKKQPENEKVNSATAPCPLQKNTNKACDVASLKVEDGASGRRIELSKSLVKELAPKDAPAHILPALAKYDAVLELLSSYITFEGNNQESQKKNVKLNISATPVGNCPLNKHLAIKVEPLNPLDKEDGKEWINTTPDTLKILGRSDSTDHAVGTWIAPFWRFGEEDVKKLVVSAEGCGVVASGKPNRALTCLIRVYRDDIYKLTFSVPPVHGFKHERKADKDLKGTVSRENSIIVSERGETVSMVKHSTETDARAAADFRSSETGRLENGVYRSESIGQGTKLSGSKDGKPTSEFVMEKASTTVTKYRDARALGSLGVKTETKSEDSKGKEKFTGKYALAQIKPTFSLKRNDKEVNFTKAVNDLLHVKEVVTKSLDDIQNWIPKVGWWLKVDVSMMTGEIIGSWGKRYPEKPGDGDRYKLVENFYDVDFNLKVIDYSVTLGAGIDFSTSGLLDWFGGGKLLEVVLKVEGKIYGEATVKEKLTSLAADKAVSVVSESTVDLYVQGKVTIMATTFDAKGGVTGGIKFEGALVGHFLSAPHIDGEFGFIETIAYVTVRDDVHERSKRFETVIFKKKEIWKGKLPNTV